MESFIISTLEQDLPDTAKLETATFGMGCFWSPDAQFGALPGVIRTRTGFAGGTSEDPTYRQMGDHTETIQVAFDPEQIHFEEIVREFWRSHYPNRDAYKGRQYISLMFWQSEQQKYIIEKLKKEKELELNEPVETEIRLFDSFTEAEERHQKYYLKRYPKALEQLAELYPDATLLTQSTFAARLNGFVKGFGSRQRVLEEINEWPIPKEHRDVLKQVLLNLKW
ncbi:peptide-methionine (S)-S-oxide reductase [Planococcus maritimus]|nr:peptide-methionine (S)-S-oxide reductase [Planococcus sp. SK3692]MDE4085522.1 peptide-methionine (S)-S-oxide reductase [Planococcus maritimus]